MIVDHIIKGGMADFKVAKKDGILKTTGLGSCVGLTLYDPITFISGMAHIMLPHSEIAREGSLNVAKYADTAIPELLNQMKAQGANTNRIVAKMAGGAQMFALSNGNDTMRIGPRNVETCKELLNHYQIPLHGEDTGANYGRTIEFYCATGKLLIRSVQRGVKEL